VTGLLRFSKMQAGLGVEHLGERFQVPL
jgi:hypothetical protein